MTALLLIVVALLALAGLGLLLAPLRGRVTDPDAAERERLDTERQRLTAELVSLETDSRRPELEHRAARTLRDLDALPPAPGRKLGVWPAVLGIGLALFVVGVGALTFVPRWQLAALAPNEAVAVKSALSLPGLQAQASRDQTGTAYLAWGDAAFDAGQYSQASSAYAGALKLDPRQPRALRRLGIMLLTGQGTQAAVSGEQTSQAFLLVRSAAQLAPNDPESQLLLGYALNTFGESKLALAALERYRTLEPQGRDADDLIAQLRAATDSADPGSRLYAQSCASCHGANGLGGVGPNLHESRLSRAELQSVIQNGKGTMPAYPNIKGAALAALLDKLEGWQK